MTNKDKKQLAAIGAIIAVVMGALIYYYRERFMPQPQGGGQDASIPVRANSMVNIDTSLLDRPDFRRLHSFGEMEVVPTPIGPRVKVLPTEDGVEPGTLGETEPGTLGETEADGEDAAPAADGTIAPAEAGGADEGASGSETSEPTINP